MLCPHCRKEMHPDIREAAINYHANLHLRRHSGKLEGKKVGLKARSMKCPSCSQPSVTLVFFDIANPDVQESKHVYPRVGPLGPAPAEVPIELAADYSEANEVMPISTKASAALSRRCLQFMLGEAGYQSKNLVDQVTAAIEEKDASKALPPALRDSFDAIRNFGNFSAHPINDKTTLQVVNVEPGEAQWCLQLVRDLFEHYYVAPARAAKRKEALNAKLAAAGKPAMKEGS